MTDVQAGSTSDSEPEPMGTIIDPAGARFWLQAASVESATALIGSAPDPDRVGAITVKAPNGVTEAIVSDGAAFRVLSSVEGTSLSKAQTVAFHLDELPAGWRFVATNSTAHSTLRGTAEEPLAGVDQGVLHAENREVGHVFLVPGDAEGLTGLLAGPETLEKGAFTGRVPTALDEKGGLVFSNVLLQPSADPKMSMLVVSNTLDVQQLAAASAEVATLEPTLKEAK